MVERNREETCWLMFVATRMPHYLVPKPNHTPIFQVSTPPYILPQGTPSRADCRKAFSTTALQINSPFVLTATV